MQRLCYISLSIELIALKQFCEKFKQQLRIGFFLGKFLSSEIIGHLCLFCEARFLCIRQIIQNSMTRMSSTVDNPRRFLLGHVRHEFKLSCLRARAHLLACGQLCTSLCQHYAWSLFWSRNCLGLITPAEVCVSDYIKFFEDKWTINT